MSLLEKGNLRASLVKSLKFWRSNVGKPWSRYLKPALVKNLFVYCGMYKSQVKRSLLPYFEYFHI